MLASLLSALGAAIVVAICLLGWLMTLIGLPGNWLMVVVAAAYAYLAPEAWRTDIGWKVVAAVAALAVVGEIFEFLAGSLGTARAGGSKRSAALALVGSVAGGIGGVMIGLPIPVIGPLVAAMAFAAVGAMTGAILGEYWKGRRIEEGWEVGKGAFWGRLFGTLGKILTGSVILAVIFVALWV